MELWSKEAPLACRNFVQLCMEGYYNGNIFHRIVSGKDNVQCDVFTVVVLIIVQAPTMEFLFLRTISKS